MKNLTAPFVKNSRVIGSTLKKFKIPFKYLSLYISLSLQPTLDKHGEHPDVPQCELRVVFVPQWTENKAIMINLYIEKQVLANLGQMRISHLYNFLKTPCIIEYVYEFLHEPKT